MSDILKRQQATILPMRERIVKETQLLYNGMLEGIYTLLNDYRDGVMAGRDYIDAQRDYWIAIAQLERATGGRLPPRAESSALASGRDARVPAPVAPRMPVSQLPIEPVKGNTP
jgi:cobalt-zinc-cadmium efflux system outer membrane protein